MKVVVADTSPLNYLILIGEVDLLRRRFGECNRLLTRAAQRRKK